MTKGITAAIGVWRPLSGSAVLTILVANYWVTNLIGIILLHLGVGAMRHRPKAAFRRRLVSALLWSVLYTAAIVLLARSSGIGSTLRAFLGTGADSR